MIYWHSVALTFQLGLKQEVLHRIYKDLQPFLPVLNIHVNELESTHKIMVNKIYRWCKNEKSGGESQQRQAGLVEAKCIQIQLNAKYI